MKAFSYEPGMDADEKILLQSFLNNGGNTWTNVTYDNSWVDYGTDANGAWEGVRYKKDMWQRLWLEGHAKSGSLGTRVVLCTLPAGYRPAENHYYPIAANDVSATHITCYCLIKASTGEVKLYDLTANSRISIHLSYEATQ